MATGDYPQHCSGCRCQKGWYDNQYISNRELTEDEYNYPETDMQVKIKSIISWIDSAGNSHSKTIVGDVGFERS